MFATFAFSCSYEPRDSQLQGYLAHKKLPHPRTLQYAYA